ncbi:MAG: T9SS type A sorting domain-containing protein [Bacteroidales bacterium]|nr:T9SS type A sorting domain-containing protein [Bacteroidales bacterium]
MKKRNFFAIFMATLVCIAPSELFSQEEISGIVTYHNEEATPLAGVDVSLLDLNGNLLETVTSGENGEYLFAGIEEGEYLLKASYDQPAFDAISLEDVMLLLQSLNGYTSLEPIQELAADVDGNGIVNDDDYFMIIENWYLYGAPFPVGEWIFEEKLVIAGSKEDDGVGGSVTGDVQGGFDPEKGGSNYLNFYKTNNYLEVLPGHINKLPISIDNNTNIGSFCIELYYDNQIVDVKSIESELSNYRYIITDNKIKIIWADINLEGISINSTSNLFSIDFDLKDKNADLNKEIFFLGSESKITDVKGNTYYNIGITYPSLKYKQIFSWEVKNYPNPFREYTYIDYSLPETGNVQLYITDISGKLIKSLINEIQPEGNYKTEVDGSALNPGIYFYQLIFTGSERNTVKNKLIKIE